jgi:threonine/homoserine/homoserine lactone efflux protein
VVVLHGTAATVIDPHAAVGFQVLVLGITAESAELLILAMYGLSAGRMATLARAPGYIVATNRVAGGLLVGAGAGLALAGAK